MERHLNEERKSTTAGGRIFQAEGLTVCKDLKNNKEASVFGFKEVELGREDDLGPCRPKLLHFCFK